MVPSNIEVPDFPVARQNLLQLANRVANLPDDVKSGLEDPESRYNFGWSHGKEKLESGKLDTFKGSFYANPILDVPTTDVSLIQSQCLEDSGSVSSWCGWHTDYGSLTGLTSGMFTKDGVEIEYPDTAAGLYIKARDGEIVKVVFGEEEMAFQIGEATEILSEGRLCATPHCVQAPKGEDAVGVERSTFAMFMQPDWDEKLKFPATVHHHKELIPPNGSLTFGEYSETLVNKYYQQKS